MNEIRALNAKQLDGDKFNEVEDYFSLNLDESNCMGCNRNLKVDGRKLKKKTKRTRAPVEIV